MSESPDSHITPQDNSLQRVSDIAIPSSLKFLMTNIKTLSQTPLNSTNYSIWSTQILKLFTANGIGSFLDGTLTSPQQYIVDNSGQPSPNPNYNTWNLIDQNLTAVLYSTISPQILSYVLCLNTSAEIWQTLSNRLQAQNRSRVIQLKNELHHLNMKMNTMTQYLSEVKAIVDQINAAGSNVDNEDIILYTLNGLPQSYESFKTAIRTRAEPINLDELYSLQWK